MITAFCVCVCVCVCVYVHVLYVSVIHLCCAACTKDGCSADRRMGQEDPQGAHSHPASSHPQRGMLDCT